MHRMLDSRPIPVLDTDRLLSVDRDFWKGILACFSCPCTRETLAIRIYDFDKDFCCVHRIDDSEELCDHC